MHCPATCSQRRTLHRLSNCCRACRRREEDSQRQQLLGSRSRAPGQPVWRAQEDMEAASMQHVRNSKRSLEETFRTGEGILASMADQRERLKVLLQRCCCCRLQAAL